MLAPRLIGEKENAMKTAKRIAALGLALVMMLAVFVFPTGAASAVTVPGKPNNFTVSQASSDKIDLEWHWYDGSPTQYQVQRSDNGGKTWKTVANVSAPTWWYQDTVPDTEARYEYRIRARNSAGVGAWYYNYVVTRKIPLVDYMDSTATAVKFSWDAVDCDGYEIQKCVNGKFVTVKTINDPNTVRYAESGLQRATTYYYRLRTFEMVDGLNDYKKYSPWYDITMSTTPGKVTKAYLTQDNVLKCSPVAGPARVSYQVEYTIIDLDGNKRVIAPEMYNCYPSLGSMTVFMKGYDSYVSVRVRAVVECEAENYGAKPR